MRIKIPLAVLFVTVLAISGCRSVDTPPDRVPVGYGMARLYDFMDVFELNAGFDLSFDNLYAVAAIEPLALGGGYYDSEKIGIDGRRVGRWRESRTEINFLVDCLIRYEKTPRRGNRYLFDELYSPFRSSARELYAPFKEMGLTRRLVDPERDFFDVSAELYVLFLGLELGVSVKELADFVAGIFTYDGISDDDWVNPRGWNQSAIMTLEGDPGVSKLVIVLPDLPQEELESQVADLDGSVEPNMFLTMESLSEADEPLVGTDRLPADRGQDTVAVEPAKHPYESATAAERASVLPPVTVPPEMAENYLRRRQETQFKDPEDLFRLAKWCEANGLERRKIWHLRQAIALDPNHAEARRMLGYAKRNGRWVRVRTIRD